MQTVLPDKSVQQIKNKADSLIKSYNEAMGLLKEASKSARKRAELTYTRIHGVCRQFDEMHAIFRRHSDCSLEQVVLDHLIQRASASVSTSDEPIDPAGVTDPVDAAASSDSIKLER
eukprot:jgi/Hompol1/3393/HPOL_006505-RA